MGNSLVSLRFFFCFLFDRIKLFCFSRSDIIQDEEPQPMLQWTNDIFVYEKHLFPLVDDLEEQDQLYIRGKIAYKKEETRSGQSKTASFINVKSLHRIQEY